MRHADILELNWAKVLQGQCWKCDSTLFTDAAGWLACGRCGRSFLTTDEGRFERLSLPSSVRGKAGSYSPSTFWVLESGEIVQGDGETFPATAVAAESRYPPLVLA